MCYWISPQFTITKLSEHVFHVRREDKDREKRFRSVILRSSLDSEGGKKSGKCYLSEAKSSLDVARMRALHSSLAFVRLPTVSCSSKIKAIKDGKRLYQIWDHNLFFFVETIPAAISAIFVPSRPREQPIILCRKAFYESCK